MRILFVEKTPFMGVELLDLIDNYGIISFLKDESVNILLDRGFSITPYNDGDINTSIDSDKAVIKILKDRYFINSNVLQGNHGLLFFYMNQQIADICKELRLNILLPSYDIQKELGNKLNLAEFCKKTNTSSNRTFNLNFMTDTKTAFTKYKQELGMPFILQGADGVSGEDTYKIWKYSEFLNALNRSKKVKVARFLTNAIPLSIHVCITKGGIELEGPYLQLVGFDELTRNKYQFSGNDTNQSILNIAIIEEVIRQSTQLSILARNMGYKGILGIDFLWDLDTNGVFVQEINSRLVGLTRLLTGIQKDQKITPHLIKHINEFTPHIPTGQKENKKIDLKGINYSQIYISNNLNTKIFINNFLSPGIYKIVNKRMLKIKNSLFVSDLYDDEILITYSAPLRSVINPNQLMAKLIMKKSIVSSQRYQLSPDSKDIINIIRRMLVY